MPFFYGFPGSPIIEHQFWARGKKTRWAARDQLVRTDGAETFTRDQRSIVWQASVCWQ
ncbi:hypothetical protein QBD00_003482 [Ochrobactrum sp. AN78]|nr:hypothetical protein [Ochrobactrum sp. AN78]